ncbi:MAG: hypothetical protein FWG10_00815 [Eubacteriaceae bacterium]|nr:hypothetical protein [Eubacteriaceae bacterium]
MSASYLASPSKSSIDLALAVFTVEQISSKLDERYKDIHRAANNTILYLVLEKAYCIAHTNSTTTMIFR